MSNNRNFHASKEEPRSGKCDSTGFKTHWERFVTIIQQRVLSVEYVRQIFSSFAASLKMRAQWNIYHYYNDNNIIHIISLITRCIFATCTFATCTFATCIFTTCFFTTCIFPTCIFTTCIFATCNFTTCIFTICIFSTCFFTTCIFATSIFTTSIFTTSIFTTCIFTTCIFTTCILTTSIFTTCIFTTCIFTTCIFTTSIFTTSIFATCIFTTYIFTTCILTILANADRSEMRISSLTVRSYNRWFRKNGYWTFQNKCKLIFWYYLYFAFTAPVYTYITLRYDAAFTLGCFLSIPWKHNHGDAQ